MKTTIRELSPSAYARLAGVLYLIITVAAIFAHMVIPEQFIVAGDAAATVANIAANAELPHFETLFLRTRLAAAAQRMPGLPGRHVPLGTSRWRCQAGQLGRLPHRLPPGIQGPAAVQRGRGRTRARRGAAPYRGDRRNIGGDGSAYDALVVPSLLGGVFGSCRSRLVWTLSPNMPQVLE